MKIQIRMFFFSFLFVFFFFCSPFSCFSRDIKYRQQLIDTGSNPPLIDSVELGIGRNDGIMRLYTTRDGKSSSGYEYSFASEKWFTLKAFNATAYCSSPVITDIKNDTYNTLYLGGWDSLGVLTVRFNNGWSEPGIISGSEGKGIILAMKAGTARNDGKKRLYVAHWSDNGLVEYTWTGSTYFSNQLMKKSVGRFAIGQGRNDGINRIYAVERGGRDLHEFTWSGTDFTDKVIFSGSHESNGSVHVADGRSDKINRVYVWAGGFFELTYKHGKWSSLTIDKENRERYYITAGNISSDKKQRVYVSVKKKGLFEYSWSEAQSKFEVDAITGATGGCSIGDGRGDGKNRLYVARGTKGNYTKAAIVEIWEDVSK